MTQTPKNKTFIKRDGFTIRQLRAVLETLPGDARIILSSDEEGNDYGLLFSVEKDEESGNVILYPASGTVEIV